MSNGDINIDAFMPAQMANRAEAIGIKKAHLDFWTMFSLAILAGAFVGAGAVFFTTTTTGAADKLAYGVTRILGGLGMVPWSVIPEGVICGYSAPLWPLLLG